MTPCLFLLSSTSMVWARYSLSAPWLQSGGQLSTTASLRSTEFVAGTLVAVGGTSSSTAYSSVIFSTDGGTTWGDRGDFPGGPRFMASTVVLAGYRMLVIQGLAGATISGDIWRSDNAAST